MPAEEQRIIAKLASSDRWAVIDELVSQLVTTRQIEPAHRPAIQEAINKRENSRSRFVVTTRKPPSTKKAAAIVATAINPVL